MTSASSDLSAEAPPTQRVPALLLRPKETWPLIAAERGDIAQVYKHYLIYLAAIPALAGFIGTSLVGVGGFGLTVRVPWLQGLLSMGVSYLLSLATVYLLALVANALAPRFLGRADLGAAFKLLAYGSTAGMVGGVFLLLPSLAPLSALAGLYSLYLIFLGAPVLMQVPQQKALGYTASLLVAAIVAGLLMALLSSLLSSGGRSFGLANPGGPGAVLELPGTGVRIDTARLEQASRRMEEAQASGDAQGAGQALGEVMSAALGGQGGAPFASETLRGHVPETLDGLPRTGIEARADEAMGIRFSSVRAQFADDARQIEIHLQDVGAVPAIGVAMTAWARNSVDRENNGEVERSYRRGGVAFKELYQKDGSAAQLSALLPNGLLLEGQGALPIERLHQAFVDLGLQQLATAKRPS